MIPQRFGEANTVLTGPAGMPDVQPVHAFRDGRHVVTAWRPSPEELVRINLGEPIFLCVHGGSMPPVSLHIDSPFVETPEV